MALGLVFAPSDVSVAAWSPLSLPGLLGWWKADALALSDGAAVSSWTDSSGNNRPLVQATGANQPLYNTGIVNGQPAVLFDGSNDLIATANFGTQAQPLSVGIVAKTNSTVGQQQMTDGIGSAARMAVYTVGGVWSYYAGTVQNSVTAADTNWHVHTAIFNGASSNYYLDGTTSILSANPGTFSIAGLTVGNSFDNSAATQWKQYIAEVTLGAATWSSTDRSNWNSYVSTKYGITVT